MNCDSFHQLNISRSQIKCFFSWNGRVKLQFFTSQPHQGCEKTAACAPPLNLIGCLLDVTQCSEVKPGGSCPVSCRFPYTGWSSVAVCRPDNVDEEVGLLVVEPECTLTCEDPPNEPEGTWIYSSHTLKF